MLYDAKSEIKKNEQCFERLAEEQICNDHAVRYQCYNKARKKKSGPLVFNPVGTR